MANKTSKKLTSDELNKFKNFIAKRQQLLSDLGSIELQLDTLSKQKESIFNGIQKLTTKYGKVSVDMNTGEITSEL